MNVPRTNIQVDQVVDPVLRIPNSRELNMETSLAQVSAANLQEATGQVPNLTCSIRPSRDSVRIMLSAPPDHTPLLRHSFRDRA